MSSGTRILYVGVRHAMNMVQDKAELVHDADAEAERALVPCVELLIYPLHTLMKSPISVLLRLSLAGPENTWLQDFSARSSALNKEHRHSVKQALNNIGMLVGFLYGNVFVEKLRTLANVFTGRENALKLLESSLSETSDVCRTATVLHARVRIPRSYMMSPAYAPPLRLRTCMLLTFSSVRILRSGISCCVAPWIA